MKLITEYVEQELEILTEEKDGKKSFAIEGVFAQAERQNRNGRVYSKPILESAVNKYMTEQVKTGRAVGELNHPQGPTINLDKVSHRISDLRWEGNNVVGKAVILNTPCGEIVKGLLEGGVKLGVSTRGMGSLEQREGTNYVKNDFVLSTVDIVQDPSAHDAFVNGIMEGVEYFYENGVLKQQMEQKLEAIVEHVDQQVLADDQIRELKNFLAEFKASF
jgi:hypothetical protein